MPTISDVAKHAGVSPATVLHVIQGANNVRPATRERVLDGIIIAPYDFDARHLDKLRQRRIPTVGIHPLEPRFNDIFELRKKWKNRMMLIGNIPAALLARGDGHRIEERVKEYCHRLAPGGGYVLSSSGPITKEIPPANLVAMTRAVHKCGRLGQLGRAA